jgi:hypothetical protein
MAERDRDRGPIPEQLQQYITSELKYIRERLDALYDRHYLLYAKVIGISAAASTVVAIVGWVVS